MLFKKRKINNNNVRRESNFELLRILAISLVVTSHYNLWSYPIENLQQTFNINYLLKYAFTAGCIANVVFVIITGYFMINAKIKYQKIISLIIEMYFYSILFLIIERIILHNDISFEHLRSSLLPFPFGNWFCVMYIIMYLILPFYNKMLNSLEKNEYRRFLAIVIVVFSVIPCIVMWNPFSGLAAFIMAYTIGAYIRLYAKSNNIKKIVTTLILVSCIAICTVVGIYLFSLLLGKHEMMDKSAHFLKQNSGPIVVLCAAMLFCLFKNIKVRYSAIINYVAGSCLGVYLIHENVFVRDYIWKKVFIIDINLPPALFIGLSIAKILLVLVLCIVIDIVRRLIFGKIENRISAFIFNKINKIFMVIKREKHPSIKEGEI